VTLVLNNVTSWRLLVYVDIIHTTLHLNLAPHVRQITGHIRVNNSTGGRVVVNDIPCAFAEDDSAGSIGLPKFFGFSNAQRAIHSVLAIDAGDYVQGMALCTLSNGSIAIEALIRTGYDSDRILHTITHINI
jgi:2',3'-cyclic-nucleotide 2'-phosphodiesterase (5'-nucleotidase family)